MKRFSSIVLVVAVALLGCGEKKVETPTVTGKVTLPDGKPLPGGRIDFKSASGNTVSGEIKPDGTYAAQVPAGPQQVAVVNLHLKASGTPPPPGLAPMTGATPGTYVPIAAKYASPDSSGLTTTVTGPNHTYDIPLK